MGGILTKKQSAALTLEAGIMNFLVLNPQVIPHRTGPSRLLMSAYRLVCWVVDLVEKKKNLKNIFFDIFFSFYPYYQYLKWRFQLIQWRFR